ncbi:hypothetical protein I302_105039 [Kwoniella bestiolae CBS 10118]|uniref:Uncharacterized protein n=1 Tax=Kwoniella bestiolae CBS 10118 TaxID=1296100 RepID=A0A1B9FR20_9TREE|nr:hypothetical protein I302_08887 [Kwoniella bestiolae CBS 10118]OCF21215.1 hypothetical protein I302_08887 [Kwoniella bestiolae CBS 10118]
MSYFVPMNSMGHGPSWGRPPPSSPQSGSSIRDTLSGWGNSARNWASGLAQNAADRLRPNTPPPGWWSNPSLAPGTAPSSNQSGPWSSASAGSGSTSNGSFAYQPPPPPQAYTPTPTQQQQQSSFPTQTQPMTMPSRDASIQSAIRTAAYTDGDKKGYKFEYDATILPPNKTYTNSIADENGKVAYTSVLTISENGKKHWDIYSGVPPPGATGTTGAAQSATGPSGTNLANTTDPTQTQGTEPELYHLPSFKEIVSDHNPESWVFGVPPADLSGVGSSKGQPLGKNGQRYSEILFEKGNYTASGFDRPRQILEDTTNWVQNRYRAMLPADYRDPWGNRAGGRMLNRHQARNLAVQFLDRDHDGSAAREFALVSWMDNYVSESMFSDTNIAFSDAPRPLTSNGLGSATSLAWDGSKLSDWAVNMVGPPESGVRDYWGVGTVFSDRQMERMMDLIDTAQSYGDDLCEAAGLDPEQTSIVSSQVGTALATEVAISRNKSADNDQKSWAYGNLFSFSRQMSNLSDDDRETYVSLASGKITIDELRSWLLSKASAPASASAQASVDPSTTGTPIPAGTATASNPGTNSTFSNPVTNSTFSNPTTPSMQDRMRADQGNWQRAQEQQQHTNSYGIPSQMQTGTSFGGVNPDGRGPNTNKPSSLKGGRHVAFNNLAEVRPYWDSQPASASVHAM